jgi:two-component system chemotaxis response regulator CheB
MKTWIGLIVADKQVKGVVDTLLKVNDITQVVGRYTNADEAVNDLGTKGTVVIILELDGDHRRSLKDLKTVQLFGPYAVLGVGDGRVASPILFDAFRLGMLDFISIDSEDINSPSDALFREFSQSIESLATADISRLSRARLAPVSEKGSSARNEAEYFISVGVPRGGISQAVSLLGNLPLRDDAALFVSLPLPHDLTDSFATRLDVYSEWSVNRYLPDERITGGTCYLIASDDPFDIGGEGDRTFIHSEKSVSEWPIDEIMRRLARAFGPQVVGVLLEGMGDDGADGLMTIRRSGGTTVSLKKDGSILSLAPSRADEEGALDMRVDRDDLEVTLSYVMTQLMDLAHLNTMSVNI